MTAYVEKVTTDGYSSDKFWTKVNKHAKSVGRIILGNALKIYYAANDEDTPVWAKTIIVTALTYFICPVDVIPDIAIPIGYSDDAAVLTAAIATTAAHIKEKHVERSKLTLKRWFS